MPAFAGMTEFQTFYEFVNDEAISNAEHGEIK
jgi:hypothetical protein